MTGLFVLFALFVVLGAYFGGTESGISAMNKIRMKSKADDGDKKAKNAMFVSNNFDKALTTLLIGNNITYIAAASVAALIASKLFGTSDLVTTLTTVVTTLIVFFFSEMIPKAFANDRADTTARAMSGILIFLMKILSPLVFFFSAISNAATKLSDRFFKSEAEPTITEEELYDIIDTAEEEGVVDEDSSDLIKSALDFSDTRARDVMTMVEDIVAIDVTLSNEDVAKLIQSTSHSRIPVFRGDINNIVGVLQVRTFLRSYVKNKKKSFRSLLMPVYHVSPNAKIDDLLSEMRLHKFVLGVVSDEDGETLGLVTIEDFLEELVGEIWDEDDVFDRNFIKLGGDHFRINTHLSLGEAYKRMDEPCPFENMENEPVISFVMQEFGHIPEEDESIVVGNLEILVPGQDGDGIDYVEFHLLTEEDISEIGEEAEG
ncbi:MAG: HlyC/CorC family transporter [Firmicutes bacterium]|nr:HlyC/CorC family transporter [Candidatus Colimorpha enterica]